MPHTVCIIQARTGSSRLPGKVLMDISGRTMLEWVVTRVLHAKMIDQVVVATTGEREDDEIDGLCQLNGFKCFRGNMHDVLDRYYKVAKQYSAKHIVRVTSDCPLIDAEIIDKTIEKLLVSKPSCDYASNRIVKTYPIGLDTEVFTFEALTRTWQEASAPYQREHVTPYMYEMPGRFALCSVSAEENYGHYRWTVDTGEDLEFVRAVYAYFSNESYFGWREILRVLESNPDLLQINMGVRQKDYKESEIQ